MPRAAAGAPSRRRLSAQKKEALKVALENDEEAVRQKRLYKRLVTAAKKKTACELQAVLSLWGIDGDEEEEDTVPRGVAWFGLYPHSRHLPTYMMELCLAHATGLSEQKIAAMPDTAIRQTWLFSVRKEPTDKVPMPEMAKSALVEWHKGEYIQSGRLLEEAVKLGVIDFNKTCGWYQPFKSFRKVPYYDMLTSIDSENPIRIPGDRAIYEKDLGTKVYFEDNWSKYECRLIFEEDGDEAGCEFKLVKHFQKAR